MATKIRWSEADRKEFAKIRKNFNAKITRMKAKGIDTGFLPPAIKQSDVYSRDDFHRVKKYASMFTERGSEKKVKFLGQEVPEYFKKQTQFITKVENARRARKRAEFTPERGTTTMAKEAEYSPMKLKGHKSVVDLMKARERLQKMFTDKGKMEKMHLYKENYLIALKKQLGPLAGPIEELLKGMSAGDFVKAIENDFEYSIDFVYSYIDAVVKAEALFNRWYSYRNRLNPKAFPKDMQSELFESAYEDIREDDFDDITARSNAIHGLKEEHNWTDLAPDEVAELFAIQNARYKRSKK